jgi:hypothetical protein
MDFLGQAEAGQGVQGERGVADPGETIVIVAIPADGFRQRCGGRRHAGAGGRHGQQPQRERAADHCLSVRPPIVDPAPPGRDPSAVVQTRRITSSARGIMTGS